MTDFRMGVSTTCLECCEWTLTYMLQKLYTIKLKMADQGKSGLYVVFPMILYNLNLRLVRYKANNYRIALTCFIKHRFLI